MKISIGIKIDLGRLLQTRLLVTAGSGAGKSWLLRKVAEESIGKVQVILLDIEGEFATLREKYDYALVAAENGDIPLNLRYAETLAHKLLESGMSTIIDLYELKHSERITFVRRFLDSMINAPKHLWHSCMIIVDEAHQFCSEKGKEESKSAVIDLMTRGRKRGFCGVLASQRLSKLNKDAAAEAFNKLIGRTGLDIDRDRSGAELGMNKKDDILSLRNLPDGDFYSFGPAISNEIKLFHVSQVNTHHPRSGQKIISNPPTPAAIKNIISKLKDLPLEAEREIKTKQDLQNKIKELQNELRSARSQGIGKDKLEEIKKQLDERLNKFYTNELENRLRNLRVEYGKRYKGYVNKVNEFLKFTGDLEKLFESNIALIKKLNNLEDIPEVNDFNFLPSIKPLPKPDENITKNISSVTFKAPIVPKTPPIVSRDINNITDNSFNGTLPEGEQKVLTCIAQNSGGASREQITINTGYKRSTRDAYILRLKGKGLCVENGSLILVTQEGIAVLGNDYQPLPIGGELRQYWINRLPGGEQAVFNILIKIYPESVSRESISEQTGYKRSTRDAYILRLMQRKLIKAPTKSVVIASEKLYE